MDELREELERFIWAMQGKLITWKVEINPPHVVLGDLKGGPIQETDKTFFDSLPNALLQLGLNSAVEKEDYEAAAYIKEVAEKRGIILSPPKI